MKLDAVMRSWYSISMRLVPKAGMGTIFAVNSEVVIRLSGGTKVVSSITKESVHALGLQQGDQVNAIVKAPHVLIGV